ncbi:MAG: rod shape-determining protein MreC [Clostridia bacterium]|nr:rod shape-determining protein MreC [Clostridia bacterium]MBQ4397786.1 rod shape-determining protein MreC [Clostridia bacterium]
MRRRFHFGSSNLSLFFTVALFMAALILYSVGTGGNSDLVSSICGVITTPIQRVSAMVSGGFGTFSDEFQSIDDIRAENELLKKKIREMRQKTVDYNELKEQNEEYRRLLELKQENNQYQFLPATVIARDAGDYYGGFTIDQGSSDGVALHDPVVTADGLVGYISGLGVTSCKVTTILSPSLEVGAVDKETRDGGTLFGEISSARKGRTRLNYLSRDCEVTLGDIVVTSGFGSVFPPNLVIGEVETLLAESENISFYAEIVPAADVKNCTNVFVITEFEGQRSVEANSIEGYKTEETDESAVG